MKYSLELLINEPQRTVWQFFVDPTALNRRQPSLVRIEPVHGAYGELGSVSRLVYESRGREYALVETVTFRAGPDRLECLYTNEFAENTVRHTFRAQGSEATLWKVDVEFRFRTLPMRVLGPLSRNKFLRQTQREMERFKAFVEGEGE